MRIQCTAEENRLRARELENAHGGVYSALAASLQKPLAGIIFDEMGVGDLETQGVEITIATGLSALSRGNENDKVNHLMNDLTMIQNVPDEFKARMKHSDFMTVMAVGRDVDHSKWLMTEEEAAAKQAEAQKAQQGAATQEAMLDKMEPEQIAAAQQQ